MGFLPDGCRRHGCRDPAAGVGRGRGSGAVSARCAKRAGGAELGARAREASAVRSSADARWHTGSARPLGGTPGGDDIEEHEYVDISSPPEESFIADPPDGKVPYQPWALARRAEHRAGLSRGWPGESGQRLYADPQTFCLYAVPRATYRGGFEILQGQGYMLMIFNFGHYSRYIPTDGRPRRLTNRVKMWMGNPRGSWQGNTLVVDVTNLNGKNWLDQVGNFVGANVRVTERFTLADANTIDYQVTFDDPTVYTRPWTIRLPLRRANAPANDKYATETWENACHEGNKAPDDIRDLGFKWFSGVVPPQ